MASAANVAVTVPMYLFTLVAIRHMTPSVTSVSVRSCAMRPVTACSSFRRSFHCGVPGTTLRMAFRSSACRWLNSAVVMDVTFISDRSCLVRASLALIVSEFFLIVAVISAIRALFSPPSARSFFCSASRRPFSLRRSLVLRVSCPISLRAGSPFTMMFKRRSSSLRFFPIGCYLFSSSERMRAATFSVKSLARR